MRSHIRVVVVVSSSSTQEDGDPWHRHEAPYRLGCINITCIRQPSFFLLRLATYADTLVIICIHHK